MQPTTLNEYYQSKGQTLPSVSERQGLAAQSGIQNYTGTAQQNTQLLGTLLGNSSNNQVSTPSTPIPAPVATGTTQPLPLPNKPQPQAQSNLYTQAAAIIANLPKTGVAGLDQTNQAIAQLPAMLYEQQGIGAKQTAASEAQTALKLFDEETRQRLERERTNPQLGAETLASRTYAIEKDRAFMAGTLAIKAAAANQDYETAMTVMKTMNEMISEPLRQNAQFFKEMYMKTEDQRFQRAMKKADQDYQRERDSLQMLNELKMDNIKSGNVSSELIAAKTIDEYYKALGMIKTELSTEAQDILSVATSIDQQARDKTRGFRRGVGKRGIFGRAAAEEPKPGTKVADFRSDLDRLKALLVKDNLKLLKGSTSDKDIDLLEKLGTQLNYTMTEDKFNETLTEMNKIFTRNYGVGFRPVVDIAQPTQYNGYTLPGTSNVSYNGYQLPN